MCDTVFVPRCDRIPMCCQHKGGRFHHGGALVPTDKMASADGDLQTVIFTISALKRENKNDLGHSELLMFEKGHSSHEGTNKVNKRTPYSNSPLQGNGHLRLKTM